MEASPQPAGSPEPDHSPSHSDASDAFAERPELFIGAAFVGGVVLAQALRIFGR